MAGTIINKFRGDRKLLQPALDFLEEKTGIPVVGVIPYFTFRIPEEDTVNEELRPARPPSPLLEIAVLHLPHISNFTDFDPLEKEPDVRLRYVRPGEKIGRADLLIIPGSKNTINDLAQVQKNGWDREILRLAAEGIPMVGICGGFQMLGKKICDPGQVEARSSEAHGLGLLDVTTVSNAIHPKPLLCPTRGMGSRGQKRAYPGNRLLTGQDHIFAFRFTNLQEFNIM